ncbi:DUF6415 family natural product biosynthesis protein [Streptomyces sp. NPDC046939]|uniref:DUF6415 family natural product biosynthesis protein n=1 Tax=Streptomyces sp. NPDC046939 TaxID=3155376 RepID=UPI0033CE17BE
MDGTVPPPVTQEGDPRPLDLPTMRAAARRLVGADPELPTAEELAEMTRTVRGMVALLVSEVATLAHARNFDDVPAVCARIGIGEARARLNMVARPGLPSALNHARRLARSVVALADHYENLGGGAPKAKFVQICRWCDELIIDPEDTVTVAIRSGISGPGYAVYAHRDHARFVQLNAAHGEMRAPHVHHEP